MRYYPVFLDLEGRDCLVIGQGRLAEEKATGLRRAGARVLHSPDFQPEQARHAFLIIAILERRDQIEALREFADQHRILLNVVDQIKECDFIAPAVMEQGDLLIAVSTSGQSPALAVQIRQWLQERFGAEYALALQLLGEVRPLVKGRFSSFEKRKRVYQRMLDDGLLPTLRSQGVEAARRHLDRVMEEESK